MDIFDKNNLNEISKYFNSKSISDLFNIKKEINAGNVSKKKILSK